MYVACTRLAKNDNTRFSPRFTVELSIEQVKRDVLYIYICIVYVGVSTAVNYIRLAAFPITYSIYDVIRISHEYFRSFLEETSCYHYSNHPSYRVQT